jgi:hypothetical protein
MSNREKRLLFFMAIVVFLGVNAGAVKLFYLPKLKTARAQESEFRSKFEIAQEDLDAQDKRSDEVAWVIKYEGQPRSAQKALTDLEQLANREAQRRGLTVTGRKPMKAVDDGSLFYHRARVQIEVSGREQVLYQWMDRLNAPSEFRSATMIRLEPKRDDDTMIDCLIVLEQWFVPEIPDA